MNEYSITRAAADARRAALNLAEAIEELHQNQCHIEIRNQDGELITFSSIGLKITYTKEL